ncbi:hypothetical protein I4U23_022639 [Adineta vaga]|nr:hypothetical protein I4U23_022639 [Adineta vaga]
MSKIQILVLHGYYDSAANRQHQMRTLTRSMKEVEFVFLNSPFPFINYGFVLASEISHTDARYQWTSYRPELAGPDHPLDTLQESVTYIVEYINQNGPFQGILGFSQGALVAAASMLHISNCPSLPTCVRFVILVGCPSTNDPTMKAALDSFEKEHAIPTLHVTGANDTLIPSSMSQIMFGYFHPSRAEFYIHKGGHYCPSDSDFRVKLRDFIQRALIM